jgi:putative peptide zinc metalloprotease protein
MIAKRTVNAPPRALAALREDLEVSVVTRRGERIAVVKDPVGHRFYELPEDDYRAALLIDASLPPGHVIARLRQEGPTSWRSADDKSLALRLQRLSGELRANGLARGGAPGTAKTAPASVFGEWQRRLRGVVSILFLRIPLGDPSVLLEKAAPLCRVFFHPLFLTTAALFVVLSAIVFFAAGGLGAFEPGWFASWKALLFFYCGLVLLKILHEGAHAVAVRHYGGKVHEAGATLVAGLPLFYVEASDSYLFPKKSQRIAVAAAGIVAELVVAAVLVWLWLLLADGFSRQLVLNLLLVASVSTVLFNGNPLMRFDGYYILADALDRPDLRERSSEFVSSRVGDFLLGIKSREVPRKEAWLLGSYGVLSQAWLIVVILGIWRFLSVVAQPHGLQWSVNLLIGAWVLNSLAFPFLQFCRGLFRRAAASQGTRRKRALAGLAVALLILAGIFFIPLPHWIARSCVLEPANDFVVRAGVDGFVAEVLASECARVTTGQILGRLRSSSLAAELESAKLAVDQAEASLRGAVTSASLAEVGKQKSALTASRARLAEIQQRAERLVLSAPNNGVVATRDLEMKSGQFLKAGDVFCVVQPPMLDEFLVPLGEKEARQVKDGARARLRLRGQPGQLFHGVVAGDPLRLSAEQLPAGLREAAGGDVAISAGAARQETLLADTHFAKVRIVNPDPNLKMGMTGRVRIECGRQTVAARLAGALADFVRLDVRMQ